MRNIADDLLLHQALDSLMHISCHRAINVTILTQMRNIECFKFCAVTTYLKMSAMKPSEHWGNFYEAG